jgi:two-component system, OmpR family, response regulator
MTTKPKIKIMYAEDEADIRAIAQIALEDLGGFDVEYCVNGVDVLREIQNFNPDILLLDVMMPVMDGITTYHELIKQGLLGTIPVIFMTAKIQADEVSRYEAMGVANVISKPFDPMGLADAVLQSWIKSNKTHTH